jgi:hypothetical protein
VATYDNPNGSPCIAPICPFCLDGQNPCPNGGPQTDTLSADCVWGWFGANRQSGHCLLSAWLSGLAHRLAQTHGAHSLSSHSPLSSIPATAPDCRLLHQSTDGLAVSNSDWPQQSRGRAHRFTGGAGVVGRSAGQQPAGGHSGQRSIRRKRPERDLGTAVRRHGSLWSRSS